MATYNKFQSFIGRAFAGDLKLQTDTCTVALTNTLPVATNSVIGEISQVDYTGLSTRNCTTTSSGETAGVYKLILDDLVLTNQGAGTIGPFRWVVVYDTDAAGALIAWYEYGTESISLQPTESLTINFDQVNGLFSAE